MNSAEKNLMLGMVEILNESLDKPILTEKQYEIRLSDLKQFEEEADFMFANSPNCPIDLQSIVEVLKTDRQDFKKCDSVEDIIEFANQKDVLAYIDVYGINMSITYTDGILTKVEVDEILIDMKHVSGIPYKINQKGVYVLQGKVATTDRAKFFVHNVIKDNSTNLIDNLDEAKELGFDVIPNWRVNNFNPKSLQSSIDYTFEYADDEDLHCKGVIFRYNDTKNDECIIYKRISDTK